LAILRGAGFDPGIASEPGEPTYRELTQNGYQQKRTDTFGTIMQSSNA
jgi:hypothetical protein